VDTLDHKAKFYEINHEALTQGFEIESTQFAANAFITALNKFTYICKRS